MAGLDPVSNVADAAAKIISLFKEDPTVKAQLAQTVDLTQLQGQIQIELAQIAADSQTVTAVNTTMQAETKTVWFARDWRPFWGWISGLAYAIEIVCICSILVRDGLKDMTTAISAITALVTATIPLWGVPLAVLGINAWHQGKTDQINAQNGNS